MDWFLYNRYLRHERVNTLLKSPKFQLKTLVGNLVETHKCRRISGDSPKNEVFPKMCSQKIATPGN